MSYFWAGKAIGAADCAWMTAVRAESAYKGPGCCAANSVQDLQKTYEHISFELIWHVAGQTGFPLTLMPWIISLYSGPRLLMLEGAVMAAPLSPSRGGLAGSRFADMCLRMNLLPTLDAYVAIRPSSCVSVYIDDLSTQSFGRQKK